MQSTCHKIKNRNIDIKIFAIKITPKTPKENRNTQKRAISTWKQKAENVRAKHRYTSTGKEKWPPQKGTVCIATGTSWYWRCTLADLVGELAECGKSNRVMWEFLKREWRYYWNSYNPAMVLDNRRS